MFSSRFSSKRGHLPKRHTLDPTLPEHSSRPPSAASLLVPRVCLIRSHTRLGSRPHAPSRRFFLFFRRLGGGGRWSRMRSRWMRWTTIETSAQMRRRRHPWNGFPLDEHGTRPHRSDNRSCADRSEHRRPTAQGRLEVCRGKGTQWRGGCSLAHVRSNPSSHNAYTRTYTPLITLHGYHKYLCVPVWKVRAVRHSIGRGSQMGSRGDSEFCGRWRGGCRCADWRGRCAAVGGWRLCNVLVVAMTKERFCRHLDW